MRGERNHLRLVRTAADVAAPVVDVVGGTSVITVYVDNVRPGQVCEVVHKGVFSLSRRVTVPDGRSSVTISTFALAGGRYEVSLRVDGSLDVPVHSQSVEVGAVRNVGSFGH